MAGARVARRREEFLQPHLARCVSSLTASLLTIPGAVIGFEGFEGGERGMHSQCYLPSTSVAQMPLPRFSLRHTQARLYALRPKFLRDLARAIRQRATIRLY
jgi:hypothetical protein